MWDSMNFRDLQVVEMTLSVFRTLFSGGCSSGYLEKNPMHIIRITYQRKFLCYAVSAKLLQRTDHDLHKAGYSSWLQDTATVSSRPTCIRLGGIPQIIRSAVCGGPNVDPEDRIEGIYQIDTAMGSYSNQIFLVPPCFFTMLIVPALKRRDVHQPTHKVKLAPVKKEKRPNELDDFLAALAESSVGLDPEGKKILRELGDSCSILGDSLAFVDAARARVVEDIERFHKYRFEGKKVNAPWVSTTPSVYGITLHPDGAGHSQFYKIG